MMVEGLTDIYYHIRNITHNSISRLDKVKLYLCRETPSRSGIVSTAILHH